MMIRLLVFLAAACVAFQTPSPTIARRRAAKLDPEVEATTRKYGLEGGLFSIFSGDSDGKGVQAKELLKQYGAAYLITSVSLALVSFSVCYVLVDNGVDVAAILGKLNIDATGLTEKAGTAAIAYAAHKAASPIRFPPTVALTPLVAKFIKKKDN
ncbi:hypothetical protein CTAYLR_007927 [Chrysophaeum taylorii]|uniref:DUF1279 domain-containing protein n=1 Tax=Chrysophaeum taylorii TaxID=2483200 RepID=A0AAD7U973_9STRA|nr:hypothetical protein CTAYLR_007927 [Chrysophaeum taylorii]